MRARIVVCAVVGCVILVLWLAIATAAAASGWSIQRTAIPVGAMGSVLGGVSCASATACTAVGDYTNRAGTRVTLAERWNGASWTIQRTPNPGGKNDSGLDGVSCASKKACTAVGGYTNQAGTIVTLVERWNGASWSAERTPNPAGTKDSGLNAVSCASKWACTAVGSYTNRTGTIVPLVERWDGSSWSIQRIPDPAGATVSALFDVSCATTTACTAVGAYTSADTFVTLVERWNGASWSIQRTPNPAGAQNSFLVGVSCRSKTACTAVGNFTNRAATTVTLAERWNGASWSIQRTPNRADATLSALFDVSCATTTACTAVGDYMNLIVPLNRAPAVVTLAERWNGASWSIRRTPNPAGAQDSGLDGVSCASTTACTAVGNFTDRSGMSVALAERYS